MVTPRGALMQLNDGSPSSYFDGLLRQRKGTPELRSGDKLFVKVVRIEPGLAIVDEREVDQKSGKDNDPFNELAEVEDWVDVPLALVGRVIGQRGARIRQICEDSGADLRFDMGVPSAAASTLAGGPGRSPAVGGAGAGADLRRFLEDAKCEVQPGDGGAASGMEAGRGDGADLCRFLEEARAREGGAADGKERQGDEAEVQGPTEEQRPGRHGQEGERLTAAAAEAAYLERLAVEDDDGEVENDAEELGTAPGGAGGCLALPRLEAVHIAGAERLTRTHFAQLFEALDLPALVDFQHLSKTEVLCVFAGAAEAEQVLERLEDDFEDDPPIELEEEGPAMWRARKGYFKVRLASTADVRKRKAKRPKEAPSIDKNLWRPEFAITRLRINGDALEVAKAKMAVRELLDELIDQRGVPAGAKALPGQVAERMKVPADLVGKIIGKGGEKIRSLEADSGARLKVLPPLPPLDIGDAEEHAEQDLLVVGTPEAVAKARELLAPILGLRAPESPRASGVPQRRAAAQEWDPNAWEPNSQAEPLARWPGRPGQPGEVAAKRPSPGGVQPLAARHERGPSPSPRTRARRLRDRKREAEIKVYEMHLMRQQRLEHAAHAAEEAARAAAVSLAAGDQELDGQDLLVPVAGYDVYTDWEADPQSHLFLGRLALTSCGPGRVARVVVTRHQQRYITVGLLAGGSVQVPEARALGWLSAVEHWLGALLLPPQLEADAARGATEANVPRSLLLQRAALKGGSGFSLAPSGLVVSEAVMQGARLAFRLVSLGGDVPAARLVDVDELGGWRRAETHSYLVELCTTPATVGHIAPYRHDYRKAREPYKKGDVVILEGMKPGTKDVGIIRKVLAGEKGDRLAAAVGAAAVAGPGHIAGMRRLLWRCSDLERARREGQATPLEKTVLPLLAARLPSGATALGVGASLDGFYLRLFVQMEAAHLRAGPEGRALRQKVAAAAAALGALLGCETELLACSTSAGQSHAELQAALKTETKVMPPVVAKVLGTAEPKLEAKRRKQHKRQKKGAKKAKTKQNKAPAKLAKDHLGKAADRSASSSSSSVSSSTTSDSTSS